MKDFSEEIKINRFKLDEECERHVSLYHYYSRARADAKAELDDVNDKLKLVLAEQEAKIRNLWDEDTVRGGHANLGKMTESGVKAALETDSVVKEIKERVRFIQKDLYILDAACYALDHRKSMLDNLVTLLVKGFYAAPNGGKREGVAEQASSEIRTKMNKGKNK